MVVENDRGSSAEVHELLPDDDCAPSLRGTLAAGETADLGAAEGSIWRPLTRIGQDPLVLLGERCSGPDGGSFAVELVMDR